MSNGPVFWHQGLFLQPQHFQRTDLRTQDMLAEMASASRPWFWGVSRLEGDPGALASGTVQFNQVKLFMPGTGFELSMPGNAVCAGRKAPESLNAGDTLDVWLGLRNIKEGDINVTVVADAAEQAKASSRLVISEGQSDNPDLYEDAPPATVRQLRYVLQIVFGNELDNARDMSLIPVARLRQTATGLTVDNEYAPPCLRLEDSAVLLAYLREIRDRIMVKTREMDSYKGLARRAHLDELTSVLLLLRSLTRFVPRLQLITDMPVAAPWDGYILLREILAELSIFSSRLNALGEDEDGNCRILPYEHNDPAPCYRSLRDAIVLLLDALTVGPRYMLRFEDENGLDQVHTPQHIFDNPTGSNSYWISLSSARAALAENPDRIHTAKFSPTGEMGALLSHALPGLPCSLVRQPPMGMPRKPGTVYLRLHTDSSLWPMVRLQEGIAMSWADKPDDLEAYFIVLED